MAKTEQDHWTEFYNSSNGWSWSIVPLTYHDMLFAVALKDAEVDEHGEYKDLYFRWIKKPKERSHKYFDMDLALFPKPKKNHRLKRR